jgi:hypothetical protein
MASTYSEQIGFGAGVLVGTRLDVTPATPRRFGILQDAQIDFTGEIKELFGSRRFAEAVATGKTKVEIKAKFAGIRGSLFNDLYFGNTTVATQTKFADSEAGTIPGTPYAITVTNSVTWVADQGVFYAATGAQLTKVASAPATKQYSVAAGVYTFAAADTTLGVVISYTYSTSAGLVIPIANSAMGSGPSFSVILSQPFDGRQANYIFNNCRASKLALPTKGDDFTISEMDFMVAVDSSGNIGSINLEQ